MMVLDVLATIPRLLDGLVATVAISGASLVVALVLAVVLVAVRRAGPLWARWIAAGYVAVVRGVPLVIVVFALFFGLPMITAAPVNAFIVGIAALGANGAAFVSEVLRGAIARIPAGQFDAAHALGLTSFRVWASVIAPQVVPIALPALVGEAGFLIKGSSLISLITVVELTRRARQVVAETLDPLTPLLAAGLLYFVLIGSLSMLARMMERRLSVRGR
jgi:His/Glu/Gln/Arg/opine family amino acid ABC transporter permease subunit